jgi:hypothetical protein
MEPTPAHYFFAAKWPMSTWLLLAPSVCTLIVVRSYGWASVMGGTWLLGIAVITWVAGFLGAAVTASVIWGNRGHKNGGPFVPGDRVLVLAGQHRGRVVQVVGCGNGMRVRVDLGGDEKHAGEDEFASCELLRQSELDLTATSQNEEKGVTDGFEVH